MCMRVRMCACVHASVRVQVCVRLGVCMFHLLRLCGCGLHGSGCTACQGIQEAGEYRWVAGLCSLDANLLSAIIAEDFQCEGVARTCVRSYWPPIAEGPSVHSACAIGSKDRPIASLSPPYLMHACTRSYTHTRAHTHTHVRTGSRGHQLDGHSGAQGMRAGAPAPKGGSSSGSAVSSPIKGAHPLGGSGHARVFEVWTCICVRARACPCTRVCLRCGRASVSVHVPVHAHVCA